MAVLGDMSNVSPSALALSLVGISIGGGRVTLFPFGPLSVFVYISHWSARVNDQNRPTFWMRLSELLVKARASWCNSTGSKSKQHDNVLMRNWNVILLNLTSFLHLVAPAENCCTVVTGTLRQSVGFPGASISIIDTIFTALISTLCYWYLYCFGWLVTCHYKAIDLCSWVMSLALIRDRSIRRIIHKSSIHGDFEKY